MTEYLIYLLILLPIIGFLVGRGYHKSIISWLFGIAKDTGVTPLRLVYAISLFFMFGLGAIFGMDC